MTEQTSTLYAKLLGETAVISWAELQPFFARGALLQVDAALDLVKSPRPWPGTTARRSPPGFPAAA